jgi:hypothetical protein
VNLSTDDLKLVKVAMADLELYPPAQASNNTGSRVPAPTRGPLRQPRPPDDPQRAPRRTWSSATPGHHDHPNEWAARRRLGVHETTGAAHFVLIDERVEEVVERVRGVEQDRGSPLPPPFGHGDDASLLRYVVPRPFLDAMRAASLDTFAEDVTPKYAASSSTGANEVAPRAPAGESWHAIQTVVSPPDAFMLR